MDAPPQCERCRHHLKGKPGPEYDESVGRGDISTSWCPAFPNGIPWEIIGGLVQHTEPYEGQAPDGPIFEALPSLSELLAEREKRRPKPSESEEES